MTARTRYWINTVSRDHVETGVAGGFTQAGHGKRAGLQRLHYGDSIVFYSPKTQFRGGDPLQAFTAIGRITDTKPWQVEMQPGFYPWRRRVQFDDCNATPIRPLIDELAFITNKQRWGFPFRRGLFEISEADFMRIAGAMNVAAKI